MDRAAKVWLAKRREDALDAARGRFAIGKVKETKRVERSETKEVVKSGGTEKGSDDSWDQNWSDDEGVTSQDPPTADNKPEKGVKTEAIVEEAKKGLSLMLTDDLEDASGWGLDEDLDLEEGEEEGAEPSTAAATTTTTTTTSTGEGGDIEKKDTPAEEEAEEEEEELEWGEWGEDLQVDDNTGGQAEDGQQQPRSPLLKRSHSRKKSIQKAPPVVAAAATATATPKSDLSTVQKHKRKKSGAAAGGSRELTLKETYTVTGMPDSVIEIIENLLEEAEQLSTNPRSVPLPPKIYMEKN